MAGVTLLGAGLRDRSLDELLVQRSTRESDPSRQHRYTNLNREGARGKGDKGRHTAPGQGSPWINWYRAPSSPSPAPAMGDHWPACTPPSTVDTRGEGTAPSANLPVEASPVTPRWWKSEQGAPPRASRAVLCPIFSTPIGARDSPAQLYERADPSPAMAVTVASSPSSPSPPQVLINGRCGLPEGGSRNDLLPTGTTPMAQPPLQTLAPPLRTSWDFEKNTARG